MREMEQMSRTSGGPKVSMRPGLFEELEQVRAELMTTQDELESVMAEKKMLGLAAKKTRDDLEELQTKSAAKEKEQREEINELSLRVKSLTETASLSNQKLAETETELQRVTAVMGKLEEKLSKRTSDGRRPRETRPAVHTPLSGGHPRMLSQSDSSA